MYPPGCCETCQLPPWCARTSSAHPPHLRAKRSVYPMSSGLMPMPCSAIPLSLSRAPSSGLCVRCITQPPHLALTPAPLPHAMPSDVTLVHRAHTPHLYTRPYVQPPGVRWKSMHPAQPRLPGSCQNFTSNRSSLLVRGYKCFFTPSVRPTSGTLRLVG